MSREYEDLEAAAKAALGEVLNLAAQIAEMQMSEEARADIYDLLNEVADHYGIEHKEIKISEEEDDEGTVIIRYTQDEDDEEDDAAEEGTNNVSYITLAVDNDKKIH
jgi:hypothetical protein